MSWKSDWLYALIIQEIEIIWKRATKDGAGPYGPAPDYLNIKQYADLSIRLHEEAKPYVDDPNWKEAFLLGPVLRQWKYDDSGLQGIEYSETVKGSGGRRRGIFLSHRRGVFWHQSG